MRIKALTSFAGPYGAFSPGQVYNVPAKLGREWVRCGFAEEVKPKRRKSRKPKKASSDKALEGPSEDK